MSAPSVDACRRQGEACASALNLMAEDLRHGWRASANRTLRDMAVRAVGVCVTMLGAQPALWRSWQATHLYRLESSEEIQADEIEAMAKQWADWAAENESGKMVGP